MNIDRNTPQKVHIEWSREIIVDDNSDRPDEMQDGFWPDRDPKAAGYPGPGAKRFAEAQAAAEERMRAWEADDWSYVAIVAKADILVPIGGTSFRILKLRSAGLWGVESDSGEDYLQSIYEEEKAELLSQLATLGAGLADAIQTEA